MDKAKRKVDGDLQVIYYLGTVLMYYYYSIVQHCVQFYTLFPFSHLEKLVMSSTMPKKSLKKLLQRKKNDSKILRLISLLSQQERKRN